MARGLQLITSSAPEKEPAQADDDLIVFQTSDSHNSRDSLDDSSSSSSSPIIGPILQTICVRPPLPPIEVTRQAGEALFMDFCQSRIAFESESELLSDALPEDVAPSVTRLIHDHHATVPATDDDMNGYANPNLAQMGRELRRLAEQFEKSRERVAIRQKAEQVDITSISYDGFQHVLSELFGDGHFSRSKVIVLFFFCSDLANRAASKRMGSVCCRLLTWSLAYIRDVVCLWVQRQGGWAVVLGQVVPKLAVTMFALFGAAAFAVYIKKSLFGPATSL